MRTQLTEGRGTAGVGEGDEVAADAPDADGDDAARPGDTRSDADERAGDEPGGADAEGAHPEVADAEDAVPEGTDQEGTDPEEAGPEGDAAAPAAAPAPPPPPPRRRGRTWAAVADPARREGHARVLAAATAALGLAALSVLTFSAVADTRTPPAPAPTPTAVAVSAPALVGPTLLTGRVAEVLDPGTVLVDVQGRRVPVTAVGADFSTTPSCAAGPALEFARTTLAGQRVTLVPDPTLPDPPATDPTAMRRAYLVLSTQLSYTDAAIAQGWAMPGEGQYRSTFDLDLARAQDGEEGMWGAPCNRRP